MIGNLFGVIEEKRYKIAMLRTNTLVLACDEVCKVITVAGVENFTSLISNQEEADTKVILHSHQALEECRSNQVLLISPSGDTDILILIVSLLHDFKERIVLDNGSGNSQKLIWMGTVEFSSNRRESLLGFHVFTGNDYVSSFF